MDKLLPKLQKAIRRITLVVSFLALCHQGLFASAEIPSESRLKNLSYEEKFFLRKLFCSFLKHDCLGHVLFCNTKPACLAAIAKKCRRKSYRQKLLLKAWQCWKDKEYLFPHPNFIFLEEEFFVGDEIIIHIFIINKKTLLTTLQQNMAFCMEILGPDFSADDFIISIEKEGVLRPLINHDEALLGLILGYGAESAQAFKKKHEQIDKQQDWIAPKWTASYTGVEAACSEKCRISPIEFMGDPRSKEVSALLSLYTHELEEIWKLYRRSKNSLELILERLCL